MLSPNEIQRALRLITSREFKRADRFPIATLANMSGVSRMTIYQARNGNRITNRVAAALSPFLQAILAGKLAVERRGQRWQVRACKLFGCVTQGPM